MNAVILTAVLSAGNSGLYVSTRMLYAMAETGQAPKCFLKLNKRGVPSYALFATVVFGLAAFLTSLIGEGKAYDWLVNSAAWPVSSPGSASPSATSASAGPISPRAKT